MILLSGKAKTHDKSVGTDLDSFSGRRPSAKGEFICRPSSGTEVNDRLDRFSSVPLEG
jgi:hypothetical protein